MPKLKSLNFTLRQMEDKQRLQGEAKQEAES
jgi:hypothetical protein